MKSRFNHTVAISIILFVVIDLCLLYSLKGEKSAYAQQVTQVTEVVETAETKKASSVEADDAVVIELVTEVEVIESIQEELIQEELIQEEPCYYTEQDIIDIAKVLYHECRGNKSKTEQACVAWVILNRVDMRSSTIHDVVRAPNQFAFYENTPIWDNLYELAEDVLIRWNNEKIGCEDVGRVLPIDYQWFYGKDGHNWFRNQYSGNYKLWDYSIESPYET